MVVFHHIWCILRKSPWLAHRCHLLGYERLMLITLMLTVLSGRSHCCRWFYSYFLTTRWRSRVLLLLLLLRLLLNCGCCDNSARCWEHFLVRRCDSHLIVTICLRLLAFLIRDNLHYSIAMLLILLAQLLITTFLSLFACEKFLLLGLLLDLLMLGLVLIVALYACVLAIYLAAWMASCQFQLINRVAHG